MKIDKRIHHGWLEYQGNEQLKSIIPECPFGKYQYICKSKKGEISLVELPNYIGDGYDWEIWSYEKLFDDVERFKSKEEAMAKIEEYLH